jgi:hypothetical protein
MPTWRNKPPNDHNVNKRPTAQQRAALADAAQLATARLYADVLEFWTICRRKKCRRHRRCAGEVMACLRCNMPTVAEHNHEAARSWVVLWRPPPHPAGQSTHRLWVEGSHRRLKRLRPSIVDSRVLSDRFAAGR